MMKTLAVVGYGNIARKHIEVFRALGCEVVAACNRSAAKRRLAETEGGIPRTFGDVHEMIRDARPEGILVCVSFWNMYALLREVIPYGIPVLAEKPTGTSLEEHLDLVDLAERHDTPVMVGLNRRHYSVLQQAIGMAGGADRLTSVLVEWSEDPVRLLDQKGYTPEQVQRVIFGNSIHGLDLLTFLAGDVPQPRVLVRDLGPRFRWIMNLSGLSERGAVVNFNANWDNFVPWRVVFTAPGRRFVLAPLESCSVYDEQTKSTSLLQPSSEDQRFKTGFFRQAEAFVNMNFHADDSGLRSATPAMRLGTVLQAKLRGD